MSKNRTRARRAHMLSNYPLSFTVYGSEGKTITVPQHLGYTAPDELLAGWTCYQVSDDITYRTYNGIAYTRDQDEYKRLRKEQFEWYGCYNCPDL